MKISKDSRKKYIWIISDGSGSTAERVLQASLVQFGEKNVVIERFPDWKDTLGEAHRPLSQVELLNRDYYRGRVASRIGDRTVFNWEEVDFDALLARRAPADTPPVDRDGNAQ